MCTVTYIPRGGGNFVLTSNRDENAERSPKNISKITQSGQLLAFPRDTQAGGTWIATSSGNRSVCLLNGAFELHHRQPPYRRSRGLMVLDFFEFSNAPSFINDYVFSGMEPFTMIIIDHNKLFEVRWDAKQLFQRELDFKACHIWSSATLYDLPVRKKREKWFREWLDKRRDFSLEAILAFHQFTGDGDPWNDLVMNRNGVVQTVSITSFVKDGRELHLRYQDLLNDQVKLEKISLQGEMVRLG